MRNVKPTERHPKVFISHSTADIGFARKLSNLLSQRTDFRVFTTEDLNVGEWESKLRQELADADLVLALLTPSSVNSNWVLQEIGAAWALQKRIIPVLSRRDVLNRIPISLQDVQAIELTDLDSSESADKFVEAFESLTTLHLA